jgi:5-methylcytosine-specific restriction endonuclease McrA
MRTLQQGNNYLKKIKNKKTGSGTDIFRLCPDLNKKEEIVKTKTVSNLLQLPTQSQVQSPLTKYQQIDFKNLERIYLSGILRKRKAFTRLAIYYERLGIMAPPDVIKYSKKIKKKLRQKHHKLVKVKKILSCPTTYKKYIESPFWTQRKNDYYKIHGRTCAICKSVEKMSLHHLKYGKYGEEKDCDLIPLCWNCHGDFHKRYGVKKNSHKDFKDFRDIKLLKNL